MMEEIIKHKFFWDLYASIYDENRRHEEYLRNTNLNILKTYFRPGQTLIEIGCGTGIEAKEMIKHGCKVVLTDVSFEMLKVAKTKVGSNAQVINLPAEYIDSFKIKFDGAYSSFGVINCMTNVSSFFQKLHSILKPGSLFIASFINRWYWGDFLFFLFGITNYLKKRLNGWGHITLNGKEYDVIARFYSLNDIKRFSKSYFVIKKVYALPFLLPPAYLKPQERLPEKLFKLLQKLENLINYRFPFNYLGERIIVIFERI
ncbi:class I SAM-dependent methyltransferase [Candidatus Kryptobacter tengchongensis]|uniref:Methyltransferase domain-containing protein n=1 Tax=Kryptobacter tengchongensis TaxID=1643429 RepID=A0A656D7I6_KRYT1|nr:class I SAM-dependent methyltransferase [Candidatus Kryptobacter tengchongensis]CUT02459.1 Methyltransferase domain-containing protein [Candidatus Kryptobacter tengchongensis]CUT02490.1 Methyltransferase domain-containing protein [Candidatus Kryptobacter tengchongensis]